VQGNLTVDGNSTLGNADGDTTTIRGITNINTSGTATTSIGNATGATNINTSAAGTTNIGMLAGANNIDGTTKINDSIDNATSINTGTSTGAVTIGNVANGGSVGIQAADANTITIGTAGAAGAGSGNLNLQADLTKAITVGTTGASGSGDLNLYAGTGKTATITAPTINATGTANINTSGSGNTAIGNASAAFVNMNAGTYVNINTSGIGGTDIGNTSTGGSVLLNSPTLIRNLGTTSINTSGTATTTIGNATGATSINTGAAGTTNIGISGGATNINDTTTTIVDSATAANTKVNIGTPSTTQSMVNIAGAAKMKIAADVFGWRSNVRDQMNNALGKSSCGSGSSANPGSQQFTTNTHGNWSTFDIEGEIASFGSMTKMGFDGRYIYMVDTGGTFIRYDTTADFETGASYEGPYELGADIRGITFDGRYIYMAQNNGSLVHRYDPLESFTDSGSYESYNPGGNNIYNSVFDGRYIYFVPVDSGVVVRYDTTASFSAGASWTSYDLTTKDAGLTIFAAGVFDGKYVYLLNRDNNDWVRYDTTGTFADAASWETYDISTAFSITGTHRFGAAVFDGRFIYLIPYWGLEKVLRYDTTAAFDSVNSYVKCDSPGLEADSGASFDGRFLYCAPYNTTAGARTGNVYRYDTTQVFNDTGSWDVFDTSGLSALAKGAWTTMFDGRYLYIGYYENGVDVHGFWARYDTGAQPEKPGIAQVATSEELKVTSQGNVEIANNLTVTGDTALGDADGDTTTIRGITSINTSGTATTSIGNATGATRMLAGTNNIDGTTKINDSTDNATSINTGTSTGAVTIGNGSAGNIGLTSGGTISVTGTTNINTSGTATTTIGNATGATSINTGAAGTTNIGISGGATNLNDTTTTIVDSATAANTKVNIGTPSTTQSMVNIAGAAKMKIAADTFGWRSNIRDQMNNALGKSTSGSGASANPGNHQFTTDTHGNWSVFDIETEVSANFYGMKKMGFDGRYIYITSRYAGSGQWIRYDTTGDFDDAASYEGPYNLNFNASGLTFDGRYMYLSQDNGTAIYRYDTLESFTDAGSYTSRPYAGGSIKASVFDGKYIYFVPSADGDVYRYDTTLPFADDGSWDNYDVTAVQDLAKEFAAATFDGRYVYFLNYTNNYFVRYDTTATFAVAGSWVAYDIVTALGISAKEFASAIFDGRFVYLLPYSGAYRPVRYDTTAAFDAASSYAVSNPGSTNVQVGSSFDGKYIYAANYTTGVVRRYDTTQVFTDSGSWDSFDMTTLDADLLGAWTTMFDGRYLYIGLYHNGGDYKGKWVRYDTGAQPAKPGIAQVATSAELKVTSQGNVEIANDLTVTGDTALGDADTDTTTIRGITNINTTGAAVTTISTGGTGTVEIGNATGATSINTGAAGTTNRMLAGTNNIDGTTKINDSTDNATSINTGTSTGAVTIGNASAGNIGITSGGTISATGTTNINTSGTAATSIGNTSNGVVTIASPNLRLNRTGGSELGLGHTGCDVTIYGNDSTGINHVNGTGNTTIGHSSNTTTLQGGTNTITGTTNINTTGTADTSIGSATSDTYIGGTLFSPANIVQSVTADSGLRLLRGRIDSDGSILQGSGFTATRDETGKYTITFSTSLGGYPAVVATAEHSLFRSCIVYLVNTSKVEIWIRNSSSSLSDSMFSFIAIGPNS